MSADKYPSIFSRQMGTTVYLLDEVFVIPRIIKVEVRVIKNKGYTLNEKKREYVFASLARQLRHGSFFVGMGGLSSRAVTTLT